MAIGGYRVSLGGHGSDGECYSGGISNHQSWCSVEYTLDTGNWYTGDYTTAMREYYKLNF